MKGLPEQLLNGHVNQKSKLKKSLGKIAAKKIKLVFKSACPVKLMCMHKFFLYQWFFVSDTVGK